MENRMKTHPLTDSEMDALLTRAQVGRLATLRADGSPYLVPVHFAWLDGTIYLHGLPKGEKVENLCRDPRVSFEVDEMQGLLDQNLTSPCATNTIYESVILFGTASLVEEPEEKKKALWAVVEKYTPHLTHLEMPEKSITGTGVIAIRVQERTGKYYR